MAISASIPTTTVGRQYHIDCAYGDLSRYILVPGDPDRVARIGIEHSNRPNWHPGFFEHLYGLPFWPLNPYQVVSTKRGNRIINSSYEDMRFSAAATGMSPGSAGIIITELLEIGCDRLIRAGTCGSIRGQRVGDIVIINEGIRRFDGYTHLYVEPEFRALADQQLTEFLVDAATQLGYKQDQNLHVGPACTTTDFYLGQGRPWTEQITPYMRAEMEKRYSEVVDGTDALIFEMEASVLLTLALLHNAKAGGLCLVVADRVRNEFATTEQIHEGEIKIGKIALEALKRMYGLDSRNS